MPPPIREPFVIIGTSFLDVRTPSDPGGSGCVRGCVTVCPGGCGRNLAEDLARLDCEVRLVSTVGDDPAGRLLRAELERFGVDLRWLRLLPGVPTGSFVATTGPRGGVRRAVVDCRCRSALDAALLEQLLPQALEGAGTVVAEFGLPPRALDCVSDLAARGDLPLCLDLARARQAAGRLDAARHAALLKGNLSEARCLLGAGTAAGGDPLAAAQALSRELGVDTLVTGGAWGCALALGRPGGQEAYRLTHAALEAADPSGAGDALLAGVLYALARGLPWPRALEVGTTAARLAISTLTSCPEDLSVASVSNSPGDVRVAHIQATREPQPPDR
ncbi:MAG: hypothetical protein HY814_10055 [Candidatus Riflebacteria bacterium]|nr:hypothetical protein [Candidatus Riflebacteria bacterium]